MFRIKAIIFLFLLFFTLSACLQNSELKNLPPAGQLNTAAEQMSQYLPLLEGRNVALTANHSSLIGHTHLVDTLLSKGVNLIKVFAPEHGFRGLASAGEQIKDDTDIKSGLPVVSLYGSSKKPTAEMLEGIDIILFDLQDVGVRFYTYISSLSYIMEAAAEENIPMIVLDRPNPNGFYIDGPLMQAQHTSFVGIHPVPVVYGMTIGEYALMVNGEKWLGDSLQCDLKVIPLKNYDRTKLYALAVKPSPNLPNWQSVFLYPSLCLFEGTIVSVGRGTDHPFTVYGHPEFAIGSFTFVPESRPEAKHPKFEGERCTGQNLMSYANNYEHAPYYFNLQWLISAYQVLDKGEAFFTPYFEKLSGTSELREQIMQGMSQEEIRAGWSAGLDSFKKTREKYLLYEDF